MFVAVATVVAPLGRCSGDVSEEQKKKTDVGDYRGLGWYRPVLPCGCTVRLRGATKATALLPRKLAPSLLPSLTPRFLGLY